MTEVVEATVTANNVSRAVMDGVASIGHEASSLRDEIDRFLVEVRNDNGKSVIPGDAATIAVRVSM
jgi:hypothetical protein